jgi:excisionase family DNA binding protein
MGYIIAKVNKANKMNTLHSVYRVDKPANLTRSTGCLCATGAFFATGSRRRVMPTTEFLNVRQTANELGVHENTVRNLERRGELKAVKLPGSGFRRFRKEDIDRMRDEMWSQFAPDTELPKERSVPSRRHTLTDEDLSA